MTDRDEAAESRIGQSVGGKYRVIRLLGRGGMGEVYEAQHAVIDRRFAIKLLRLDLAKDGAMVARFQREARVAGGLENENIVAVVDAGTADDGSPYLVMEYLEGEDLGHLLSHAGPLPVGRAVSIVTQACRGLAAAHGRSIIHRDLKPENLFVCRRNDGSDLVKVLDFGIAKLQVPQTGASLTNTGAVMGTPFYMSLEQARGAKNVDQRTDVYSLGVILYEALGGAKPHPGDSYSEVVYHLVSCDPTPLGSLRKGLPRGLAEVVHRAIAREADDRYGSVAHLMGALAQFGGPVGVQAPSRRPMASDPVTTAATPGSVPGIAVPTPVPKDKAVRGPREVPSGRARRWSFGVALVIGTGIGAAAMLLTLTGSRSLSGPGRAPDSVSVPVPARPAAATATGATMAPDGGAALPKDDATPAVKRPTPESPAPVRAGSEAGAETPARQGPNKVASRRVQAKGSGLPVVSPPSVPPSSSSKTATPSSNLILDF